MIKRLRPNIICFLTEQLHTHSFLLFFVISNEVQTFDFLMKFHTMYISYCIFVYSPLMLFLKLVMILLLYFLYFIKWRQMVFDFHITEKRYM